MQRVPNNESVHCSHCLCIFCYLVFYWGGFCAFFISCEPPLSHLPINQNLTQEQLNNWAVGFLEYSTFSNWIVSEAFLKSRMKWLSNKSNTNLMQVQRWSQDVDRLALLSFSWVLFWCFEAHIQNSQREKTMSGPNGPTESQDFTN